MNLLKTFRLLRIVFGDPDKRNLYTVPKFANAHKDMLVIIADPQTDRLFLTHQGRIINARIRNSRGRSAHVVRDMLKNSQFKRDALDGFIVSVADALKLSLPKGNTFYQWLDGAIFNMAKSGREAKKMKKQKADRPPASRGILSPIRAEGGRPEGDI